MPGADKTALIALASAASWGGGDFCGGMGSRSAGGGLTATVRLVLLAQAVSLAWLLGMLRWQHAALPHGAPMVWALAAGIGGCLGSVAFFKALSQGGMGAPAAVSGLLAAAIPAVVSSGLEGTPGPMRLAGFALAAAAIWLVAAGESPESPDGTRGTMALAIFSGVAFGFYLVALKFANPLGDLMPVALARMGGVGLLGLLLLCKRETAQRRPWSTAARWAMGLAVLDTGGNILFVTATRTGRLDVASVLASLYPAGTILLAAWRLHERPTPRQVAGMVAALVAVVIITL